jgi:ketosteroid isomerase-like protein
MSTTDLAKDFVGMLKKRDDAGAAAKYNADSIASYEAMDGPMAVCNGKDAVKKKGEWWTANHEVHSASAEGPYVNGDQFVVHFKYDVTPKETGKRMQMDEVGIYTVKNGKIVEERFCYMQP